MTAAVADDSVSRHRRARTSLLPTADDCVDAGFLLLLSSLSILGLHAVFGSDAYLAVAGIGFAAGLVLAHLTTRFRQPPLVSASAALLTFFLLGSGIVLRTGAAHGVLPTGPALRTLAMTSVRGWEQVLTSAHPIGGSGPLLTIPYVLGLSVAVAGFTTARRSTLAMAPLVAPALVLVISILFGSPHPGVVLAQGAGFAVTSVAWASFRSGRARPSRVGLSRTSTRLAGSFLLLALAFGAASVLGPRLPFTHRARVVLQAAPPFDVSAYPSPLAAYRQYTRGVERSLFTTPLLTAQGPLPYIQLAVLDHYDGSVWGVANGQNVASTFVHVRPTVPSVSAGGALAQERVTVDAGYHQVWLPDAPGMRELHFTSPDGSALADNLRFQSSSGTGVVPQRLQAGDSYLMTGADAPLLSSIPPGASPVGSPTESTGLDATAAATVARWTGGASSSSLAAVAAIATHLHAGQYGHEQAPGEDIARLDSLVHSPVGDDEQFAAAMAVLANLQGVPARVLLYATPEPTGLIRGSDVRATVQLDLLLDGNRGWVTLSPSIFTPVRPENSTVVLQQAQQQPAQANVPPAQGTDEVVPDGTVGQADAARKSPALRRPGGPLVPHAVVVAARWVLPPLVLIGVIIGGIVAAKVLRRRRRRHRGTPRQRAFSGWTEIVDAIQDLGHLPSAGATRREIVAALPGLDVGPVAAAVDAALFGAAAVDDRVAEEVWSTVDAARARLRAELNRRERVRTAVSLVSFRRRRRPATSSRHPARPAAVIS